MPIRKSPTIAASDQRSTVRHHSGRIGSPGFAGAAPKTMSVIGNCPFIALPRPPGFSRCGCILPHSSQSPRDLPAAATRAPMRCSGVARGPTFERPETHLSPLHACAPMAGRGGGRFDHLSSLRRTPRIDERNLRVPEVPAGRSRAYLGAPAQFRRSARPAPRSSGLTARAAAAMPRGLLGSVAVEGQDAAAQGPPGAAGRTPVRAAHACGPPQRSRARANSKTVHRRRPYQFRRQAVEPDVLDWVRPIPHQGREYVGVEHDHVRTGAEVGRSGAPRGAVELTPVRKRACGPSRAGPSRDAWRRVAHLLLGAAPCRRARSRSGLHPSESQTISCAILGSHRRYQLHLWRCQARLRTAAIARAGKGSRDGPGGRLRRRWPRRRPGRR